jgi:hypothetical protein
MPTYRQRHPRKNTKVRLFFCGYSMSYGRASNEWRPKYDFDKDDHGGKPYRKRPTSSNSEAIWPPSVLSRQRAPAPRAIVLPGFVTVISSLNCQYSV